MIFGMKNNNMKILITIFIILLCVFTYMFRFEYSTIIVRDQPITLKTDRLLDKLCIYSIKVKDREAYEEYSGLKMCD